MSNQIFISYKREDKEFALKLAKDLKAAEINIWIDQLNITPGEPWDNAIENALYFCSHFMVILSPASVKSEHVKDEIAFALEEKKLIIPVFIKECEIPFRIRRLNYIDFTRDHGSGLTKLLEYLNGGNISQKQKNLKPKAQNEEIKSKAKPRISSQKSSSEWYNMGMKSEDVDEKIKLYSKAIELNPEFAMAFHDRGSAFFNSGQYDKAIKDYNKAIELNPEFALVFYNRGLSFFDLGQYDKAIKDYGKAIEMNPKNALAFHDRGSSFLNLGQYDKAIKDYGKAIELNPEFALAFYNRGLSFFNLGQYDKAIKDYGKAIEMNPKNALAFHDRGSSFLNLGQYDKAIKDYGKAIELNPEFALAFKNRGIANRNMKKNKNAADDFKWYLKLEGNKEDAEEIRQWIRDLGFFPINW
mgnify:CR=1 FL=1